MRIVTLSLTVCILAALSSAAHAQKSDFIVAAGGSDHWTGRLAAPNRAKSDGPFATLDRARLAVRELRKREPNRARPVVVALRGGRHELPDTLRFTPEDSGTTASATVYMRFGSEKPILSGGRRLSGWTVRDGRWTVALPSVQRGEWAFSQLWVNGARRFRPRLPKRGYFAIEEAMPPSAKTENSGFDRFQFRAGDIDAKWANLQDVEVLGFQVWTMARLPIASVDAANRVVTFAGQTAGTQHYAALPKGNRYLVENVREALADPGTFYLDRKSGVLTYVPAAGESPEKAEVIAPRLQTLLTMEGSAPKRAWVSHVEFRGLAFAHVSWVTPPQGQAFPQAEINLGGAVSLKAARGVTFRDCAVTGVGTYALEIGEGCRNVTWKGGRLADLGAGGVKIGTTRQPTDEEEVTSRVIVEDAHIAHGGRIHPAAVGVWIGNAHHVTVRNCEIADFYYTGVSVGWSWGYGKSLAHHNVIEGNHIHDIGQRVLNDMGGIYTLGVSPGTVLRGNRIHDINSFGHGSWGIYPDEGSTGILIEDNVVFRTKSAGFHQHYGRENVVHNNVFAFGREAQIMRTRPEEHLSFTFENNIVLWTDGPLLGSNWSGNNYKLDRNLYWNAAGQPVTFAGMSLEAWRAKRQDVNSVLADPLFLAPAKGDFRLRPNSPALALGFKPIDPRVAGPVRKPVPLAPSVFPPPP